MARKQKEATKPLYLVHCTECGESIENKFFPLDKLLGRYYNGNKEAANLLEKISDVLRIGAYYGQKVLPEVPALMTREEVTDELELETKYTYRLMLPAQPDLEKLKASPCRLEQFACEENEIPKEKLVRVELNIAAIVAQFYLMTGFSEIYQMLELKHQMQENGNESWDIQDSRQQGNGYWEYCDKLAIQPGVQLQQVSQAEQRRKSIDAVIANILKLAEMEANQPGKRHFAADGLKVGWRYKEINGREMPLELTVMSTTIGDTYRCSECCCDKCRSPIPYEFGAYQQKIIGVLGTQATGKTTYLTALTDAIDLGEVTAVQQSNGSQLHSNIHMEHSMSNDAHWKRINQAPKGDSVNSTKAGSLWLYKHGFPPEKTDVKSHEAPALTFLVSRKEAKKEPVMYTLADIPGEAFSNSALQQIDADYVAKLTGLLHSCDALIMVISSRQMLKQADPEKMSSEDLLRDPNQVLSCYKQYLPSYPVPTAVVLTAADEINGGNLREPFQLAYDIRNCEPLVFSGKEDTLVYNVEAMRAAGKAVSEYINIHFGQFLNAVEGVLKEKAGYQKNGDNRVKLAAFAVSSGTQHAKVNYTEADEEYRSQAQAEQRCRQMREARFGLAGPLLWLLACDDVLQIGRPDSTFNGYADSICQKIYEKLRDRLCF